MISRDAWLAHIEQDSELHVHHQDEESVSATWKGREAVFCHRFGLLTTAVDDAEALGKLDLIARSSSEGGLDSSSRSRRSRRSISRNRAAGAIALAGVVAVGLGRIWMDYLFAAQINLGVDNSLVEFLARTIFMTGAAAVLGALALAVSGLLPWKGRAPLYAAIILGAVLVALLTF